MNTAFEISPFLPVGFAVALAVAAVVAFILARKVPDLAWRGGLFLLLAGLILNPVALHEVRQALPDKLVIVVDGSASQKIAGRDVMAQKALDRLTQELAKDKGIEPVIIRAAGEALPGKGESTALFAALRNGLPGVPLAQAAGTVFITDGQVHDVPASLGALEKVAPFNAVLTGKKDEFDRKITVLSAPKYGLLSEDVKISIRVDEFGRGGGAPVAVTVMQDGKRADEATLSPGSAHEFTFRLNHAGQNVFEFSAPVAEGELTAANNTAAVIVNGIRDRLRVLLVSGTPHMGERAWRNLLKSDPSIDLVHFTILRSLTSIDTTPSTELSLIVFPVEELFQRKLDDFDLIIFDRYQQLSLLTQRYFANIAAYVKNGGAFLMAMGSDQMDDSIFNTALGDVLPVAPKTGGAGTARESYAPQLTEAGKKHPVTGDLQRLYQDKSWGPWFTQAEVDAPRGQVLMTGAKGLPLLVLDKVGEGRVAALSSDNVWLWSKSAATGGPYNALLRNVAHWLMKEPELEDDYIKAEAKGDAITVSMRDLGGGPKSVVMTRPSQATETLPLDTADGGWVSARVTGAENGIYSFASGERKTFVVVGTAASEEFSDVHTTEERLKPVVGKTGGTFVWFQDAPEFSLGDLKIRRNGAYAVTSVESRDLVPGALALLLILCAAVAAWWRESGRGN